MANPFFYKKQMDTTYIDSATSFDTWVDQGDNSHDLTAGATNEPAFNFGDSASEYNPFLRFDGTDDYLSAANHANFNFGANTDFSLEVIFRTSSADIIIALAKGSFGGGGKRYGMNTNGAGGKITGELDDNTTNKEITSNTAINDGEYHHIIMTADRDSATGLKLYVDGSSDATAVDISGVGDIDDAAKPLAVGIQSGNLSSNPWDGDIALVRIWNRVLSSAEVLIQYNAGDFWQQTVPTADQWGNQTAMSSSNLENDGGANAYDTFDGASPTAFHAVDDGTGSPKQGGTADEVTFVSGQKVAVEFTLSGLTGELPIVRVRNNFGGTSAGTPTAGHAAVVGSNYHEFTITSTTTGVVEFRNGAATEYTISNFKVHLIGAVAEWRLAHENAFSPFEFPKGRQLPVNFPIVPRQIVGVAGGGQTVVDDLGDADERWPINVLRVNATVRTNLLGFLQDSTVNYREQSFQFVEEDATDNEVRLWEPFPLDFPRVPGSLFNLVLTVRKEIS